MVNDDQDGEPTFTPYIADAETSASYQDGSSSEPADETAPDDAGSTAEGRGLTDGGTGTEVDVHGDITKGGMAGDYGDGGSTVGGTSSGEIGTVGTGIPPKPKFRDP